MPRQGPRRKTPWAGAPLPLPWSSAAGVSVLATLLSTGIVVAILAFAMQRGLQMMQLSQSTVMAADGAALERMIADNMDCAKTLGPAPVSCPTSFTLRGADGSPLTGSQGQLGTYNLTASCTAATPMRLVIKATASKVDPLHPKAGLATMQLFKRGSTYTSYYPCMKYMNVGPRYKTVVYPGSSLATSGCTCNMFASAAAHGPSPWCHNRVTMTCPAGYTAAAVATNCAYKFAGTQLGQVETAYAGAGTLTTNFSPGSQPTTVTLAANQGHIDCCSPLGAVPNPAYISCVRN